MANKKPEITAEWTVHAQLTIIRPPPPPPPSTSLSGGTSTSNNPENDNHHQSSKLIKNNDKDNITDDTDTLLDKHHGPVKVIYKWSTNDFKNSDTGAGTTFSKSTTDRDDTTDKSKNDSFHSTDGVPPPSDSGVSTNTTTNNTSSRIQSPYNARCRSTCSIILSACTDLPTTTTEQSEDPFTYNTTASYTLSPDQSSHSQYREQLIPTKINILSVKDAFSQTSDYENKFGKDNDDSVGGGSTGGSTIRSHKPYDYRRATDSMLSPPPPSSSSRTTHFVKEGKSLSPSIGRQSNSPIQQIKKISAAAQMITSPTHSASSRTNKNKKAPRTVHIDVYCTASDAEDDDDDDDDDDDEDDDDDDDDENNGDGSTSSASTKNNKIEEESNSTPQTVFNSNQMKLNHMRILEKNQLPRRLGGTPTTTSSTTIGGGGTSSIQKLSNLKYSSNNVSTASVSTPSPKITSATTVDNDGNKILHFGALTKSDTKEEINESKQMLFNKHIGDQTRQNKFKSRGFNFYHRSKDQQSDDCLSSNYPNSSRSTVRDMTCSSIASSALASSSAIYDELESSWKETDGDISTTYSYNHNSNTNNNNINNRYNSNIYHQASGNSISLSDNFEYDQVAEEVERNNWKSPEKDRKFLLQQKKMLNYLQEKEKKLIRNIISTPQSPPTQTSITTKNTISSGGGGGGGGSTDSSAFRVYTRSHTDFIPEYLSQHIRNVNNRTNYPYVQSSVTGVGGYPTSPQECSKCDVRHSNYIYNNVIRPTTNITNYSASNVLYNNVTGRPISIQKIVATPQPPPLQPVTTATTRTTSSIVQTVPSTSKSTGIVNKLIPNESSIDDNTDIIEKHTRRLFTPSFSPCSQTSSVQSHISGYTDEHLARTRKFGAVVGTMRKPGHHIGPAKNPDCQCEHCRRWLIERDDQQRRGRTLSLGDVPNNRSIFWLSPHQQKDL